MRALGQLAVTGDDAAARELAALTTRFAGAASPVERRAAAAAIGSRADGVEVSQLPALLDDSDASVRNAALDAVAAADAGDSSIVERVIASLGGPDTTGSATAAVRRLGEPAVPALVAALGAGGVVVGQASSARRPRPPRRMVRRSWSRCFEIRIAPSFWQRSRRSRRPRATMCWQATSSTACCTMPRRSPRAPRRHGHRSMVMRAHSSARWTTRSSSPAGSPSRRSPFGTDRVFVPRFGSWITPTGNVVRLASRRSTSSSPATNSTIALPLVRRETATGTGYAGSWGAAEWIADLASDPIGFWRSPWLAACARAAAAEHQPAPGAPSR